MLITLTDKHFCHYVSTCEATSSYHLINVIHVYVYVFTTILYVFKISPILLNIYLCYYKLTNLKYLDCNKTYSVLLSNSNIFITPNYFMSHNHIYQCLKLAHFCLKSKYSMCTIINYSYVSLISNNINLRYCLHKIEITMGLLLSGQFIQQIMVRPFNVILITYTLYASIKLSVVIVVMYEQNG